MTKHSSVFSVWRRLGSTRRRKQASVQHFWWLVFWKPLTQSEIREVQVWGKRILWFLTQRGWMCVRLLISLWTSVASIRRAVSHRRGEVRAKWKEFYVRALDEAGRQQRQVHKEFSLFYSCLTKPTCFCFSWSCLLSVSASLRAHPVSIANSASIQVLTSIQGIPKIC